MLKSQQAVFTTLIKKLVTANIPYLVTGSVAAFYYGYPRATHDIDFVIEAKDENKQLIAKTLGILGRPFLADRKDIIDALNKRSSFNLYHLHSGTKIDFFLLKSDLFSKTKFKRRKKVPYRGLTISITSAEDLILTKLLWCKKVFSERHFNDCLGIWKIQKHKLDEKYLSSWAERLGIKRLLKKLSTWN